MPRTQDEIIEVIDDPKEVLEAWSEGRADFESVREFMAELLLSGKIPLRLDGWVDLDAAYAYAVKYRH